ncbi:L-glutamine synthetase [Sulfitobacter noctilucicola]|uniref:Glutamine synthetase n=1 Tax=Sulfitobacter noctilucicola TaxID=1342301 RepID=A0A7W6Q502_9RHOB|nr:glutamine synthetase family protein [Sulfitobacter noctilucicola]KIN62150.1 L-glutamine synthetase [Sulfitobacter noctilucicola]MBB4173332.1 glutamine synthetase [Sulfitobacter noctilucicola]
MTDLKSKIESGALARAGLRDSDGIAACADVIDRLRASDIETVRVLFPDQHGILRGKTVVADALPSIMANGMAAPSTLLLKDTSHRTVFPVWSAEGDVAGGMRGAGDILMVPDPDTFRPLPWSPHSAWIICDLAYKDGSMMPLSTRGILRNAVAKLAADGKALVVGLEVEFHVFRVLDPRLDHAGATMPAQPVETQNIAQGYQFLTETHYDVMEPVMDALRRTCQALGMDVRSMEVEMGPSQIEFTFDPADPLTHADNMVMLRTAVKEVCARQGLHATFMCKPNLPNAAASGWHLHQSLIETRTGKNLFMPEDEALSETCSRWIAGLLAHASEGCLLSTPTVNGYKRYQPHQLAPNRIAWGRDNRGAMIRALTGRSDPASRIENRIAEPAANPYLFFASQIIAGMAGLRTGRPAPPPVEDPYDAAATPLPQTLAAAVAAFGASELYRSELGDAFVDYLCRIRRSEWDRYHLTVSQWEQQEYFGLY